jgi:hypothetical protein
VEAAKLLSSMEMSELFSFANDTLPFLHIIYARTSDEDLHDWVAIFFDIFIISAG